MYNSMENQMKRLPTSNCFAVRENRFTRTLYVNIIFAPLYCTGSFRQTHFLAAYSTERKNPNIIAKALNPVMDLK